MEAPAVSQARILVRFLPESQASSPRRFPAEVPVVSLVRSHHRFQVAIPAVSQAGSLVRFLVAPQVSSPRRFPVEVPVVSQARIQVRFLVDPQASYRLLSLVEALAVTQVRPRFSLMSLLKPAGSNCSSHRVYGSRVC